MTFQVLYFDEDGPIGQEAEIPTFIEARKLAKRAVSAGTVTSAEVRDASGSLILTAPRSAQRTSSDKMRKGRPSI